MAFTARTRWTLAALAAALVGVYWYLSPYLALREMRAAVAARDADAFNAHVDYPQLRANVEEQWVGTVSADMAASLRRGETGGGAALLLVATRGIVDALVRPETVMFMLAHARFRPDERTAPGSGGEAAARPDAANWHSVRRGPNQLDLYFGPADAGTARGGLVLQRTGFATWRLTGVHFPRN